LTGTRTDSRGSSAGLTLLETIVAALILAVALVGLLSALVSEVRLRRVNKERALARNAAERTLSAIRGMPTLVEAYQRFGGAGPEATFVVPGLAEPAPGQPVGRVIVWRRKGGNPPDPGSPSPLTGADLQEARTRFGMGFPLALVGAEGAANPDFLDTNTDGAVNVADTPSLMPVTVRIRWRSHSAVITEYFTTLVGVR
jgi:hypothetical protein